MTVPRLRWAITPNPVTGDLNGGEPQGTAPFAWVPTRSTVFGPFIIGNTIAIDFASSTYAQLNPGATFSLRDGSNNPVSTPVNGLSFSSAGLLSGTVSGSAVIHTWNVIATYLGVDYPYGLFTLEIDDAPSISVEFPRMTLAYDSLTPHSGGKGMESSAGFARDNTGTRWLYADDLGDNLNGSYDSATRTGYGSLRWCCAQTTQSGWPNRKVVVLLRDGYYDIASALRIVHDNTIICGQGAHAKLRNGVIGGRGLNHLALMHISSALGDDMSKGPAASGRDVINFGNASATAPDVVGVNFINCDFGQGMDEGGEAFYGLDRCHWQDTAWIDTYAFSYHLTDGVVTPPGTRVPEQHSAGPLVGGANNHTKQANFITILRNLFAHNSIRNPKLYAKLVSIANCICYNFGKASTDDRAYNGTKITGGAIDIASCDRVEDLALVDPVLWNAVYNLFVRGLHNSDSRRFIGGDDEYKAGSQLYLAGNSQRGWSGITTQQQFASDQGPYPSGWYASAPIAAARPSGWGNDFEFIRQIAANAPNPTVDETVAFIQALGARVGARPGYRSPTDRLSVIVNQMIASAQGLTPSGGIVNSKSGTANPTTWNTGTRPVAPAAGPDPVIPNVLHTPSELGIPSFSEGRDVIQGVQLSVDGTTDLARRSKGEKALLDLHYDAMGDKW